MKEFREVEGFPKYLISSDGDVYSKNIKRNLSKFLNIEGYYQVHLCNNDKCKTFRVHRIVAKAFIDNPNNYPQINHIDGNKTNNDFRNLEWCTLQQNINHAIKNHLCGKLCNKYAREIRSLYKFHSKDNNGTILAKKYGVSIVAINNIVHGKTYKTALLEKDDN